MYTDVNIFCENRVFKCHRVVLAAACEYFHLMFRGNFAESHTQDVVLHDFDSITFEKILLFVYRGEIATIDDDNVFNLLRASDILELSDLEDHCVHYLSQKNIPMDCALEIYLFASALHKIHLLRVISPFILQHLDRFSQESKFLGMSFENFSSLLTYFQPTSPSQDAKLLNGIRKWVCHSTHTRENRKLSFIELATRVRFKSVTAEQVAEYFDRNSVDSNDEYRRSEVSATSDMDPIMKMNELSLHVYVKTAVKENVVDDDFDNVTDWVANQTRIFSVQAEKNVDKVSIGWHHSGTLSPVIEAMRIVKLDGRLYHLNLYNDQHWIFSSSTAFDLCTNVQLAQPATRTSMTATARENFQFGCFSLCCLQEKIYLNSFDFQCYNTKLDMWSPIPILSQYKEKNLVNDDARLYMIEKYSSYTAGLPRFAAYDPRTGKVEKLNDEGFCDHDHYFKHPGCYHKNRIYLVGNETTDNCTFEIPIYDTVAGRWDHQNLECSSGFITNYHRFVSFNNHLYMLGEFDCCLYTYGYDTYLQEWNRKYSDDLPRRDTFSNLLNYMDITDVIAY